MSKVFRIIVSAAEIAVGVVTFNPALIINGAMGLIQALTQHTPKPPATETALKSPTPPRISAYGRSRLYPAYALFTTATNGTACDAYALHEGRIDGYERFYLGDKQVATSTGVVSGLEDGAYKSSSVHIDARLGLVTETAFSQLISLLPDSWTSNHRGDGVATAMATWKQVKAKDYPEIYPNGQPPLSASARWQRVFDWRDETQDVDDPDTWKWSENSVLHTAHYELMRDNKDWATHFAPTLSYWTAAADDCDVQMALSGVQAVLTEAAEDDDNSIEINSVNGLAIGMTISISATGDTSLTETRTVSGISGLTVSLADDLDHDHPSGSQVTWFSDGETPAVEARYRSCVAHAHTDEHKGVKANLIGCFDGWLAPRSDGALIVYSGRYYAPTVTIGPDEIIGYSLQDGVAEEDAVNQLAVTYISENHDFATVDTDAWEDADDIDTRGKILPDRLENQVPSASQARRLAKRKMAQVMAPKRGTVSTNAGGRSAIGQRYIRLRLVDAGDTFLDAPVEITKGPTRNLKTGGVTFDWVLADPNIDAWDPTTEQGGPAPIGNPVAPEPLVAPVIADLTLSTADASGDFATGARILVDASAPDRSDLTWFLRWRVFGTTLWQIEEQSDIDPGTAVEMLSGFVPVNATIELEIAYQVGDGRLSPWSATETISTSTAALPPDPVNDFMVTPGASGEALAEWTNSTSLSLAVVRLYRNTVSNFSTATQIDTDIPISGLGAPDSYAATGLASGATYFWMTAVSSSGAASAPVSFGPVTIA